MLVLLCQPVTEFCALCALTYQLPGAGGCRAREAFTVAAELEWSLGGRERCPTWWRPLIINGGVGGVRLRGLIPGPPSVAGTARIDERPSRFYIYKNV